MKNIALSKEQAIEAMKAGKKVAHRYFSPHEWVKMEGNFIINQDGYFKMEGDFIINQDGYSIPVEEFWKFRYRKEFLTDWYIWEDTPVEELHIKGEYAVGNGGQTYKNNGGYDIALIVNDGNVPTCLGFIWGETKEQAKANAQRIVTCVNNHDTLVTALEELIPFAQAIFDYSSSLDEDKVYESKIKAAKDLLQNINQQ